MSRLENDVARLETCVKSLSQYADELEYAEREIKMWRERYLHQQSLPVMGNRTTYVWPRFKMTTCKEMTSRTPEVVFESLKEESTGLEDKNKMEDGQKMYGLGEISKKRDDNNF